MADLDLTRLGGGTRASVACAVEALGRLGNFVGATLDLVHSTPFDVDPDGTRAILTLITNARDEMDALRAHLGDLVKAEELDALDGPTGEVFPRSGEKLSSEVAFQNWKAMRPMDLWERASQSTNAASDARDLSMVLTRALGTHDVGFGPDELAALYTVAGLVTDRITEAVDRSDAVCGMVEPDAEVAMGGPHA